MIHGRFFIFATLEPPSGAVRKSVHTKICAEGHLVDGMWQQPPEFAGSGVAACGLVDGSKFGLVLQTLIGRFSWQQPQ